MRKVDIGTSDYTEVFSMDSLDFYANHVYQVRPVKSQGATISEDDIFAKIKFQRGPIKENGINGCHNEDLIAIVIDRLQHFQDSPYQCRANDVAITKLEEALMWMRKRTEDRIRRNVEGTSAI